MREVWRIAFVFACTSIWQAFSRLSLTDQHFQTRKLSNDVNGVTTLFRPDEIELRTESWWLIVCQILLMAVILEVYAANNKNLEADFCNTSLDEFSDHGFRNFWRRLKMQSAPLELEVVGIFGDQLITQRDAETMKTEVVFPTGNVGHEFLFVPKSDDLVRK